jgi:integrase/recombinase XerC
MLNKLINLYLKKLKSNDKSDGTIETFGSTLEQFVKWYEKTYKNSFEENLKIINSSVIEEYKIYLTKERHNSSNTKKGKLITLNLFFKFLKNLKKIDDNPINDDVNNISVERNERDYFTDEEYSLILSNIKTENSIRDKTIIELITNTGLRLSELVQLNIGSVSNNYIKVFGKGKKTRSIPLNDYIKNKLYEYMKHRNPKSLDEPLFTSKNGCRINRNTIQKMINKILIATGLKKGCVHIFRHTYATSMLNKGLDIFHVSRLLGHESIETTQIYLHAKNQDVLYDFVNSNPIIPK